MLKPYNIFYHDSYLQKIITRMNIFIYSQALTSTNKQNHNYFIYLLKIIYEHVVQIYCF